MLFSSAPLHPSQQNLWESWEWSLLRFPLPGCGVWAVSPTLVPASSHPEVVWDGWEHGTQVNGKVLWSLQVLLGRQWGGD